MFEASTLQQGSSKVLNDIYSQAEGSFFSTLPEIPSTIGAEVMQHELYGTDSNYTSCAVTLPTISESNHFNFTIQYPELEQHLLQISAIVMQAIPLSSKDKTALLLPTAVPQSFSLSLKNAMFANAVMFSSHPLLFPNGQAPTNKHRIDVGRKFASKSMRLINNALAHYHFAKIPDVFSTDEELHTPVPFEAIDMNDIIRAMLALSHFAYGIGEGVAIKLIGNLL